MRGKFEDFEGTLEIGEDDETARAYGTVAGRLRSTPATPAVTSISARPTSSASSRTRSFASSRRQVKPVDDETFEVVGDLTMNGVTKPITLTAEVQGEETDPWGNERVALEVTGQLNRGDWNMTFNQALGSGNLLVGEKVKLQLDIAAVKQA